MCATRVDWLSLQPEPQVGQTQSQYFRPYLLKIYFKISVQPVDRPQLAPNHFANLLLASVEGTPALKLVDSNQQIKSSKWKA